MPKPMRPSGSRTRGPSRLATDCGPARVLDYTELSGPFFEEPSQANHVSLLNQDVSLVPKYKGKAGGVPRILIIVEWVIGGAGKFGSPLNIPTMFRQYGTSVCLW